MARDRIKTKNDQRGFGLVVMLTVAVLGFCWYAAGSISNASSGTAAREARTSVALKSAKDALLAYVAQRAADTAELYPGRLPCPEVRSVVRNATLVAGTGNAAYDGKSFDTVYSGYAGPFDATTVPPASAAINCDVPAVGRFPWKTFGIEQLRDGDSEPLWYAVANSTGAGLTPWAWTAVNDALVINPASTNQVTFDGAANAVVAVIIAPGSIMNTISTAGAPPAACARVNQNARWTPPITIGNFLECGNAAATYTATGTSSWSGATGTVTWGNDRAISITAAEVMSAISGAIADRLQRQVAPAIANWDATEAASTGKSWGTTWLAGSSFLPFASNFNTQPSGNDYCGDAGAAPTYEGLPPIASKAVVACSSNWSNVTSAIGGLGNVGAGCVTDATQVRCTYSRIWNLIGTTTITADAPSIVSSFRGTIQASDVIVTGTNGGGTPATKTVSMAVTSNPDRARITVNVSWPILTSLADLFYLLGNPNVTVTIPHVADAQVLSDSRMTWFLNNNWNRWTYYQVATGSAFGVTAANACPTNLANCITVNNLPASNGNQTDKKFVLTFMGTGAVAAQVQPNTSSASYLEAHTAPSSTYSMQTVTSTFNDRLAMCPFQQTRVGGTTTICN